MNYRGDMVVVDHPQPGDSHMLWIVVVAETEAVAAVEPADVG